MVARNEVVLPIFQTDIRWKKDDVIKLLNYQLKGNAPVAPISFNRITTLSDEKINVTFLDRVPISSSEMQGTDKYNVVDGQQRLSCNYKAATDHEEFRDIVLDLGKGSFIDIKGQKPKLNQIPVGKLYNKESEELTNYLEALDLKDFDLLTLLTQIRSKFFNYDYIVNNAHDLSFEDQIGWFNVLNLAGSTVPEVQMRLTNLQVKGIDFYKEYSRVFCEKVENEFAGIMTVKTTEVFAPLSCLNAAYEVVNKLEHRANYSPIPSDQRINDIYISEKSEIYKYFNLTLESVNQAIEFIRDNKLSAHDRLDYITYLSGFFVWNQNKPLLKDKTDKLIKWYNTVKFTNKSNGARRDIFTELVDLALA